MSLTPIYETKKTTDNISSQENVNQAKAAEKVNTWVQGTAGESRFLLQQYALAIFIHAYADGQGMSLKHMYQGSKNQCKSFCPATVVRPLNQTTELQSHGSTFHHGNKKLDGTCKVTPLRSSPFRREEFVLEDQVIFLFVFKDLILLNCQILREEKRQSGKSFI